MKNRLFSMFTAIIGLMIGMSISMHAWAAAPSLKLLTGSPNGTYYDMGVQLVNACPTNPTINIESSGGSIDNVDALFTNNTASLAIVQIEALYALKADPAMVQVLFALHPEQVHLIVSTTPRKIPSGNFDKLFGTGDRLSLDSSSSLARLSIGAWGGSLITAGILNDKLGLNANVVDMIDEEKGMGALSSNKVDAIVYVAGVGNKLVSGLPMDKYRLIPVDENDVPKLSGMFMKDQLTYTGLRVRGMTTVSTQSVMIMRVPKKGPVLDAAKALQSCFMDRLDDIQATLMVRSNWAFVKKPGDTGYVVPKWQVWSPTSTSIKTK